MSSDDGKESNNVPSNLTTPDFSIDFSSVVKSYTGLITFVDEAPPPGKQQLSHFLFPFYVYIYIFLLKNQKFYEAKQFISIFFRLFSTTEGYAEMVKALTEFKTVEDFQDHSYLKNFCEDKYGYKVQLTEDNLKLLKKYLKDSKCWILSHILDRKFNIEVLGDNTNHEHATESSPIKKKEPTIQTSENLENSSSTRNVDNKETNTAIKDQRNHEHTTESSSIKKKELVSQNNESLESSSSIRNMALKRTDKITEEKNRENVTKSLPTKKKKSTPQRIKNLKSNSSRMRNLKRTNIVTEDQSNHENAYESLHVKINESSTQRTKNLKSNSSTRIRDLKRTNVVSEDQSHQENTTEYLPVMKQESTSQKYENLESSSTTRIVDIEKVTDVGENQRIGKTTPESSSIKVKESTMQQVKISESNSASSIDVKEAKSRFSREVPCYHYTISCRKEQLCCVDINQTNTLLACGFENSGIHVWNIQPNIVNKSVLKNLDPIESKCLETNFDVIGASSPSLKCVLNKHSGGVYGLAYASDLLMSCSEDTTARAWSMTDFKDIFVYCDHKHPIWDITVSKNCAYFATASLDCTARLWNFETLSPLRIFCGHSSDVDHVRFHSNCRYLATASADKTIQLWAVEDGRSMRKFPGHDTHINSIAFSPDGKHIASADDSGLIKIWDLASGKLYGEIVAHSKNIFSISYNSDSSLIASCGLDSFIKIWDVKHSLPMDEKRKSEVEASSLVDSHSVDSVPYYVGFHQKDFLISVGAQTMTEH